jgi:hypothetical protein
MAGPLPIRPITTRWARPWAIAGDNEAFTLAGVPALRICDTDRWRYPYWHRADDGPGMVDGAVLATVVDTIARGVAELLKEPPQPAVAVAGISSLGPQAKSGPEGRAPGLASGDGRRPTAR